jgi:hypothetical protein
MEKIHPANALPLGMRENRGWCAARTRHAQPSRRRLAFAFMSFIIAAVQAHGGCFSTLGTPSNAGSPAGLAADRPPYGEEEVK